MFQVADQIREMCIRWKVGRSPPQVPARSPPWHEAGKPAIFYPRYVGESLVKLAHYWRMFRRGMKMLKKIENEPDRWTYSDLAVAPPQVDEFESLDLYHATSGGEAALARTRRNEAIIASVNVTAGALDGPKTAQISGPR